jgi:hypothetical protein
MTYAKITEKQSDNMFAGSHELWERLDAMALAILGVGASEFIEGYRSGRYSRTPIAHDLASLIPFTAPTA